MVIEALDVSVYRVPTEQREKDLRRSRPLQKSSARTPSFRGRQRA